ncbi:centrosomal protein of 170 kDa-like isoform X3 [Asterias rubens]|uniref:centrosomal protein of 170 kDa-like isoform X3 n=1 Tax=Asterias rubens TaxID=7604 RepID=UPI001455AE45|nr:centrosomal protein of 170 kDa-like isoform X3 [Asterias rubens]
MTWCLVGNSGVVHLLPKTMMFVGRENCEINIPSRSVDRRHSVITFDRFESSFSIKDMETLNGTFVNDTRIPDQTYIGLHRGDSIRFGYDPITYRFDEVDDSCIRQFTAENGVTKMQTDRMEDLREAPDVDEGCRYKQLDHIMEEEIIEPDTTNSGAYLTRPHTRHDEHHASHQYEHRANAALENNSSMSSHSKTSLPKQDSVTSPPSALYGQPAWWGQDDRLEGEEFMEEKEEDSRQRSDTYTSNGKDMHSTSSTSNVKQLERPTKLPLNEAERDIPIHMYTRRPTDLNPTTPSKRAPTTTPEHTEVTLVSASEKHVGFTIEFNAKEDAPKMSMNESLSEFVPATVKNKIEESTKIVEGRKAERKMKKSYGDDPDSYQSPRVSPSAVQKLNSLWATSPGKKGPKVGQGDSRSANNSEASKVDSSKQLKVRPLVSPRQPTTSKSGPVMSRSSLGGGHHRSEAEENQNGDNVSESGTYTIESEDQSKEVLEARSKIDEVFGVDASMDTRQGSDEDTDKDVGDGEIEEEAVTAEAVHTQQVDINRYLDQEYGKPNGQESVKPSDAHASFQPKPPATGSSSTTPAWVRQWAVLANKDNPKPTHEHGKYIQGTNSHSPRDHGVGEEYKNHTQDHAQSAAPKPPPRRSGGKRLLPTTPPERGDQHLPHSTSLDDSPRTNGIRQSPSSAFYSPRNPETTTKEVISPPWGTRPSEVNPTVSISRADIDLRQSHDDDGLDLNTEVSMDTDLLLKDTETFVKNLEMRMRGRKESTPSPELSESYDYSHRSFDGDIDTDLDSTSCVGVVGSLGNTYPQRGNQASLPPSGYQGKRSSEDRNAQSKSSDTKTPDSKSKKGSIWNRLSQPVRYKRTEKTPQSSKNKDSSAASDCMSDSMDSASFRRNTSLSASLPTGRVTGRKTPKESDSRDTSPKIIRKIKANLSKPRQTRSTMLRKSRFDGKDSPGPEQQDIISPSSSMSDMSSSRNPSMLRRSSLQKDNGRCQSPKDMHARTKTTGARIDTGRQRLSSRSSDQTPRSEVSLGGQIAQHARSQSLREPKTNAGEMSSRIMGKTQNSSTTSSARTSTTTASRKLSQSSSDASPVKKASTGTWRRYKEPPADESENINAYIRSVTGRHSSLSSADESSIKSAPIYNHYKPRSNSSTTAPQQKTVSMQQLRGSVSRSQHELRNGDDIAQASNSLAQSLQRLAKGEGAFGMAMENIPKDERMMDEIFSEDTVGVNSNNQRQTENYKQPLQRSTSVSNNIAEGLYSQTPVLAKPGSPPISLKHKQWSKPESFDMLVMSSISHLSIKLKDASDKVAYKLKKLQSPNATDAELALVLKDTESPLLKTHNKEIATILRNMRQLEKRLTEINEMIDPREEIQLPQQLTPAAQIRRQYISDSSMQGNGSKTQPWSKPSPAETPRSARSDESEYYL